MCVYIYIYIYIYIYVYIYMCVCVCVCVCVHMCAIFPHTCEHFHLSLYAETKRNPHQTKRHQRKNQERPKNMFRTSDPRIHSQVSFTKASTFIWLSSSSNKSTLFNTITTFLPHSRIYSSSCIIVFFSHYLHMRLSHGTHT